MKLLITGSNGLLGQKIVRQLKREKISAFIASSKGENRISDQSDYLYEPLDVTDPQAVRVILEKHRPDSVIHTAAMTNVNACESDRDRCRKINVDAVDNLATICRSLGIHLVHVSTDFVFDGKDGPYQETDTPHPVNFYGKSKLEGEKLVQTNHPEAAILRTILLYGVAETMSHSNFLLWAKDNLSAGKEIKVITDQYRSPTLAEDLAAACITAATRKKKGIYHIGGPDLLSIYAIVSLAAEVFHLDTSLMKKVTSAELGESAPRPPKTGFILDKAKAELDYQPHSLRAGLELVKQQLSAS